MLADNLLYAIAFFLLISFIAILQVIKNYFNNKFFGELNDSKNIWDRVLIPSVMFPFEVLVYFISVIVVLLIVDHKLSLGLEDELQNILKFVFVSFLSWSAFRILNRIEDEPIKKFLSSTPNIEETTKYGVIKFSKIFLFIISLTLILPIFGFQIRELLTLGAASSIVVALAARELIANFFGGLIIYFDRPFAVGDWVKSADREIEGNIEYIGWRFTRIRTFESTALYVPNTLFASISLENPSRMVCRRMKKLFRLRYVDLQYANSILTSIRDYIFNHKEVDSTREASVHIIDFSEHGVDILIYLYVKTTNKLKFLKVQEEIFFKINDIVCDNGGKLTVPQKQIEMNTI